MNRPSLAAKAMKDGLTITPGWAAVLVTLFLAAAAAGASGLAQSAATATKVQSNTEAIREVKGDVKYIRARIDMALDRRAP